MRWLLGLGLCLSMWACSSANSDGNSRTTDGDDAKQGGDGDGSGGNGGSDAFDNGGDGDGAVQLADAGPPLGTHLPNCDPGTYVGTYSCPLEQNGMDLGFVLEGAVAFDLAIDESVTPGECEEGQEFCFDLVIAEGSGKLFGFVGFFIGFETGLEGGLDCTTGEFHATAVDGVWGIPVSSDPSDPNAPATVSKPPSGTFDGGLDGMHQGGDPQIIDGAWDLVEATGYRCAGPFTVERQP